MTTLAELGGMLIAAEVDGEVIESSPKYAEGGHAARTGDWLIAEQSFDLRNYEYRLKPVTIYFRVFYEAIEDVGNLWVERSYEPITTVDPDMRHYDFEVTE